MEKAKAKMNAPSLLMLVISVVCWLIIIVALLFTILRATLGETERIRAFYDEYRIEEKTGISTGDATRALTRLIDYMNGDAESIQLVIYENGRQVEAYNQQEIDHMVDVRALYQSFAIFRGMSLFALVVIVLAANVARRNGVQGLAVTSYYAALILIGAVVAGCLAWAALDFTSFWTGFHHLFFTNDLWLMDYATCRMIRICPEGLFAGICARLALRTILILGGATALAAIIQRRAKNIREHREHKE